MNISLRLRRDMAYLILYSLLGGTIHELIWVAAGPNKKYPPRPAQREEARPERDHPVVGLHELTEALVRPQPSIAIKPCRRMLAMTILG